MISFKEREKIEKTLAEIIGKSEAKNLLDDYDSPEECKLLFEISGNCLLVRVFEEEKGYYFLYPVTLTESADVALALTEISAYCVSQEIPEVISEVQVCDLPAVLRGVLHADVDSIDGEGLYFAVSVKTEAMLLEDLPEHMYEDIYLCEPCEAYAEELLRLYRDKKNNRFWGYDLADDIKDFCIEDILSNQRDEFARSASLTWAVTVLSDEGENVCVGEAVIYAFDGRGGAEAAFRVLPEWQGRGYGRKILLAEAELAGKIGLRRLICRAARENVAATRTISKVAREDFDRSTKETVFFEIEI